MCLCDRSIVTICIFAQCIHGKKLHLFEFGFKCLYVVNYCLKSRYLASVDRKGSGKSKKAINEKQVILYVIFVRN